MILIKIHNKRGTDADLIKTYNVRGYPTFVLENVNGETLHRWWGYRKESFLKELSSGIADPTTISEKITRFEDKPDLRTALALASNYSTVGDMAKVVAYYSEAAKLDPSDDYAFELYSAHRRGFGHPYTEKDIIRTADMALASNYVNNQNKLRIYDQMSEAITRLRGDDRILGYIKSGQQFAKSISDEDLQYLKNRINIAYVLYFEKNEKKAIDLKKKSLKAGWMDDARYLNTFSWWCFEHQINLGEAESLASRGVKLAEPGSQRAMILDTLAEIVFLKGDIKKAVLLIKDAIKEYPDSDYYKKQLNRFENSLAADR